MSRYEVVNMLAVAMLFLGFHLIHSTAYPTGAGSCFGPLAGHGPPSYHPTPKMASLGTTPGSGGFRIEHDMFLYADLPNRITITVKRCPYDRVPGTRVCEPLAQFFKGFLLLADNGEFEISETPFTKLKSCMASYLVPDGRCAAVTHSKPIVRENVTVSLIPAKEGPLRLLAYVVEDRPDAQRGAWYEISKNAIVESKEAFYVRTKEIPYVPTAFELEREAALEAHLNSAQYGPSPHVILFGVPLLLALFA